MTIHVLCVHIYTALYHFAASTSTATHCLNAHPLPANNHV